MNYVFVFGKIIEDINFDFLFCDKRISIANSKIVLNNNSEIGILGYNKIADFMYINLNKNSTVSIFGILHSEKIEILEIKIL